MKIKTLRKIDTKEFVHLQSSCVSTKDYLAQLEYDTYTCELPMMLNPEVDMENITQYYKNIDFSNIELVEFELFEANTVGADIRNKLSPVTNLIALLNEQKKNVDTVVKEKIQVYIDREIEQSNVSINYICNLL